MPVLRASLRECGELTPTRGTSVFGDGSVPGMRSDQAEQVAEGIGHLADGLPIADDQRPAVKNGSGPLQPRTGFGQRRYSPIRDLATVPGVSLFVGNMKAKLA